MTTSISAPEDSAHHRNAREPSLIEEGKHNGQIQSGKRDPAVTRLRQNRDRGLPLETAESLRNGRSM